MPSYFAGLDLGQTTDYTAFAVLEQEYRPRPDKPAEQESHYLVSHLERVQLGTPYTGIVARVGQLIRTPPLPDCALALDQTGVGRPVTDMFRQADLPCWLWPITITAGAALTEADDGWHVPKKELVSTLQVLLQFRRLKVVGRLPEMDTLKKELANFRVKVTAAANETYGAWRDGVHDDLVLAVALAAWVGEQGGGWAPGAIGVGGRNLTADVPRGVFGR